MYIGRGEGGGGGIVEVNKPVNTERR